MTLYQQDTGKEQRRIQLKDYNTMEDLRKLMTDLGFRKRTKKEYENYKKRQRKLQVEKDQENAERVMAEQRKVVKMKKDIAERVLKMMEENLKKQQEEKVIKV